MNTMQFPKGEGFWTRAAHTPFRDWLRGRVSGRLNIDAAIGTYELPEACVAVVREVVKKTRLWRLEKVEVAHELSAHFRDGLDAGRTDAELMADFGDATRAAKLIRRAKIRCRPLAWHACRWFGLGMAGFVAVYLVLIGLFMLSSPDVRVNYLHDINAAAEATPTQDRAWPVYREAMIKVDTRRNDSDFNRLFRTELANKSVWPEKVEWLHHHANELQLIRRASQMPHMGKILRSGFDPEDKGLFDLPNASSPNQFVSDPYLGNHSLIEVFLPSLGDLRSLAMALAADFSLAVDENDVARAVTDFRAIQRLAFHNSEIGFAIAGLVSLDILHRGDWALVDALRKSPERFSDVDLAELAHLVASRQPAEILSHDLPSERLTFRDVVQRVYSDNGSGNGHLTMEGLRTATLLQVMPDDVLISALSNNRLRPALTAGSLPFLPLIVADRKEMLEKYEQMMDLDERALSEPMWRKDVREGVDEINAWSESDKTRYFLVRMMKAFSLRGSAAQATAYRDGVLLGLALVAYERQHHQWPAALADLSPRFMPTIPVDPVTGEALHYKVGPDGPLVYSVGVNRRDDGGRPTPIPSYALLGLRQAGNVSRRGGV